MRFEHEKPLESKKPLRKKLADFLLKQASKLVVDDGFQEDDRARRTPAYVIYDALKTEREPMTRFEIVDKTQLDYGKVCMNIDYLFDWGLILKEYRKAGEPTGSINCLIFDSSEIRSIYSRNDRLNDRFRKTAELLAPIGITEEEYRDGLYQVRYLAIDHGGGLDIDRLPIENPSGSFVE